jgi:hypothetical protein
MDSKEILEKLQGYMSLEMSFTHTRFKTQAEKLDKEELLDILNIVHTNYLIRNGMFKKLVKLCIEKGVSLPPMSELWDQK